MDSSAATLNEEKEFERSPSPTPVGSINKDKDVEGSFTEKEEDGSIRNATPAETSGEPEVVYPTGFKLGMIIVALVLSIFLVCLSPLLKPVRY